MKTWANRRRGWTICAAILVVAWFAAVPSTTYAYTPDSPEVRQMIERAMAFLDQSKLDYRLGGKCLVALAFYKEGYPHDHKHIQAAVEAARQAAQLPTADLYEQHGMYSIGIATIFLAELDPKGHRDSIERYLRAINDIQRPYGGWGYPPGNLHFGTGDTSMTQYAVLSLWTADHAGIPIPIDSVRSVCGWLLRTQAPAGCWGYQGHDPGGSGERESRMEQTETSVSMTAAGLGSVYVCSDLLGVSSHLKSAAEEEHEFFVPAALVLVGDETQPKRPRPVSDGSLTRLVSNATADGNHWFEENYAIDYPRWRFYYLYSLERYQSFRELAEKNDEPEPRWYNDGVEFLQSLQKDAGGFGNSSTASEAVDAAFATLFLMRSTKKSINKEVNYGDGLLAGGRGLPKNLADARVKRGKIVGEPLGGSADDVLSLLEDPNSPNFDKLVENPENVMVSPKLADDDRELDRLRRVIQGGNYAARKVAVRALATRRNLDNVPILIYALSDPDPEVAVEARDALRFISRRFRGFNMPENPTLEQRIEGINAWKKWYLSIRPDAEFLN